MGPFQVLIKIRFPSQPFRELILLNPLGPFYVAFQIFGNVFFVKVFFYLQNVNLKRNWALLESNPPAIGFTTENIISGPFSEGLFLTMNSLSFDS